jgi:hypothetical protein
MSDTVFCEQCGASIRASASFCASCGSAQTPVAPGPAAAPPLTAGRDTAGGPPDGVSTVGDVASQPEPATAETVRRQSPSPVSQHGPPSATGRVAVSGAVPGGRLSRALNRARRQGDSQAVASFWLGWSSFGSALIGVLAKSSALYFIGVVLGVVAIVTARFARQRARAAGDADLVYLSRYGQITGWIVVGLLIAVLLFWAVFVGSFLGSFSH